MIFVLYIRIWHGDLNLRYQSKGNHGGEVNVCQEFQLALAGAPDSSYKSSKKKHTPLLATLISALIYCFTVFLPCPENAPPREGLTLAPPRRKKPCPVHPCHKPFGQGFHPHPHLGNSQINTRFLDRGLPLIPSSSFENPKSIKLESSIKQHK